MRLSSLTNSHSTKEHKDEIFKGIACGLAAFFSFAVMSAAAKLLSDTHSIFEISFYRCAVAILPLLLLMAETRNLSLLKVKKPKILFWRVFIGNIGMVFTFGAVKYLPLADATLIFLSAVLITPIMAFIFLSERMGIHRWGAVIIGFIGVAFVLQPSGEMQIIGALLALGAAFTHSSIQVLLRALREENSLTIVFYFTIGGLIMMAPFMPFTAKGFDTADAMVIMLIVGLSGLLGQIFISRAFSLAPASTVSPFNMTGLLWATLFDIAIWSYIPGWPVFTGAAMIIIAKLYILHRERIHAGRNKTNRH